MYEEKDEEGISLLDLLKVAFGRKILLLIITLSVTLVGALFLKFYYNKNKTQYYVNYSYVLPGIEEGKYIDDSKFNYQMLISPANLKAVKSTNEEFSSIDIDKMVDKDGISVACDITRNQATNEIEKMTFNITAKTSYFKNAKQANKFIHAVADQPYTKTLTLLDTMKYDSFLESYKTSNVYDTKVTCLLKQYELLETQYKTLFEKYGDVALSDGKKLSHYLDMLTIYFTENRLDTLTAEIRVNGYVKDYVAYEKELENTKTKLIVDRKLNENKISALQQAIEKISTDAANIQAADIAAYNELIAKLIVENVEINEEIDTIDEKLANKSNTDAEYITNKATFDAKIEKYNEALTNYTADFSGVLKEVVTNGSYVSYNNNTIYSQGGIRLLIGVPALLILGCFIGCIVNVCLDHKKLGKQEEKEEIKENN